MTYFLLETIAAPLASLATLLGLQARSASQPAPEAVVRPVPVPSRPAEAASVSPNDAPAEGGVYPDYRGYDSGCMAGVMAAMRAV